MNNQLQIKKATRQSKKVKIALIGIAGSGKTYSALAIAKGLGEKVLVIDTEHGSASAYAEFDFDTIELSSFAPATYVECIRVAESNGYDVVVLDSLSHAWTGKDGAIEQVDKAAKRSGSGNSFNAWRDVTPQHNEMVEAIVGAKVHVIATLRAKTEYIVEQNNKGKSAPRKVGLAPVQRDGMEYEFDLVMTIDQDHQAVVTKSRILALSDEVIDRPGTGTANIINDWLNSGAAAPKQGLSEKGQNTIIDRAMEFCGADKPQEVTKFVDEHVFQNYKKTLAELTKDEAREIFDAFTPKVAESNPQQGPKDDEPESAPAEELLTEPQHKAILAIGGKVFGRADRDAELEKLAGLPIAELTKSAASELIAALKEMQEPEMLPDINSPADVNGAPKQAKHVQSLCIAAQKAGLSMHERNKSARLTAFNFWLKKHFPDESKIESFGDLAGRDVKVSNAARVAIDRAELKWPGVDPAPAAETEAVEGEIVEDDENPFEGDAE